ncbi:MAG: aminotransferase class V-fold PLP-dependent enzyme [Candidatus Promineifilaceae bacterium]
MYDIEALRRSEFPHSAEHIYLHHAGISPIPKSVETAVTQAIHALTNNPNDYWGQTFIPLTQQLLTDIKQYINATDTSEIGITTTTVFSMNTFAHAIQWQPGDAVALCDVEFPSNAYPWMSLTREGVKIQLVPAQNGGLTVDALKQVVDSSTRLVTVSAIQFLSGHKTDLQAIGEFCHTRGILFAVDAIQAIGHMPIDVQAMHIDMLATGGQKSLLAMPGIGFMYVRRELSEQMQPRYVGSNSTVDFLHWLKYDMTPLSGAARFNMGTPNVAGTAGLAASIKLLSQLGPANIEQHTNRLTAVTTQHLTQAGFHVITPTENGRFGPICTFASGMSNEETDELVQKLAKRRVTVGKHLDAQGTPYIRAAFHAYNTEEEAIRFVEILQEEIKQL